MNKNILATILVVLLIGIAYFYFMARGVEAPTQTTDSVEQPQQTEQSPPTSEPTANDGISAGETTPEPVPTQSGTEAIIGMTVSQAQAYAEANDILFRVVEIDGEPQMVTEDFRPGRINATSENGVIVSYEVEGSDVFEPEPADNSAIIGMTTEQAQAYAQANGVPFRIGAIDGEFLPVTMDYRPGRITAEVENGIVTNYSVEE